MSDAYIGTMRKFFLSFELNASNCYRVLVWTKFWSRSTDYLRLIFFLDAKVEILKKVP